MQRYLMLTALHVLQYCEDIKQTYTQILDALQIWWTTHKQFTYIILYNFILCINLFFSPTDCL